MAASISRPLKSLCIQVFPISRVECSAGRQPRQAGVGPNLDGSSFCQLERTSREHVSAIIGERLVAAACGGGFERRFDRFLDGHPSPARKPAGAIRSALRAAAVSDGEGPAHWRGALRPAEGARPWRADTNRPLDMGPGAGLELLSA